MFADVAMSRGYGCRGGCPAADVPDVGDGSVEWFGGFVNVALIACIRPT